MRFMANYDFMETMRNTNQWIGASAQAFASNPGFAMMPNPALEWMAAWGQVTERSFQRMSVKPDWGIDSMPGADGRDLRQRLARLRQSIGWYCAWFP